MKKNDREKSRAWYLKNRDRLLLVRRKYNKLKYSDPEFRESERVRNTDVKRKEYRKMYKKTKAGKESNRKYRLKPEVKVRYAESRIKRLYGITTKDYWELVALQGGVCAICNKSDGKKLHIDHDHETKVVRGLLCGNCNRGLGLFKEDLEILNRAREYLNGKIHTHNRANKDN